MIPSERPFPHVDQFLSVYNDLLPLRGGGMLSMPATSQLVNLGFVHLDLSITDDHYYTNISITLKGMWFLFVVTKWLQIHQPKLYNDIMFAYYHGIHG